MFLRVVLACVLISTAACSAKVGGSAQLPHVAIYPGAQVVSNGENQGVIGANLTVADSIEKVRAFYGKELNVNPPAGAAIEGVKDGHPISVIVTDAGGGKTAVAIIERKP